MAKPKQAGRPRKRPTRKKVTTNGAAPAPETPETAPPDATPQPPPDAPSPQDTVQAFKLKGPLVFCRINPDGNIVDEFEVPVGPGTVIVGTIYAHEFPERLRDQIAELMPEVIGMALGGMPAGVPEGPPPNGDAPRAARELN